MYGAPISFPLRRGPCVCLVSARCGTIDRENVRSASKCLMRQSSPVGLGQATIVSREHQAVKLRQ